MQYAISGTHRNLLAGVISQAPLFELHPSGRVNPVLKQLLSWVANVLPNHQMYSLPKPEAISRDEKVNSNYVADPLCHGYGTLRGLRDMLNG